MAFDASYSELLLCLGIDFANLKANAAQPSYEPLFFLMASIEQPQHPAVELFEIQPPEGIPSISRAIMADD